MPRLTAAPECATSDQGKKEFDVRDIGEQEMRDPVMMLRWIIEGVQRGALKVADLRVGHSSDPRVTNGFDGHGGMSFTQPRDAAISVEMKLLRSMEPETFMREPRDNLPYSPSRPQSTFRWGNPIREDLAARVQERSEKTLQTWDEERRALKAQKSRDRKKAVRTETETSLEDLGLGERPVVPGPAPFGARELDMDDEL